MKRTDVNMLFVRSELVSILRETFLRNSQPVSKILRLEPYKEESPS